MLVKASSFNEMFLQTYILLVEAYFQCLSKLQVLMKCFSRLTHSPSRGILPVLVKASSFNEMFLQTYILLVEAYFQCLSKLQVLMKCFSRLTFS